MRRCAIMTTTWPPPQVDAVHIAYWPVDLATLHGLTIGHSDGTTWRDAVRGRHAFAGPALPSVGVIEAVASRMGVRARVGDHPARPDPKTPGSQAVSSRPAVRLYPPCRGLRSHDQLAPTPSTGVGCAATDSVETHTAWSRTGRHDVIGERPRGRQVERSATVMS